MFFQSSVDKEILRNIMKESLLVTMAEERRLLTNLREKLTETPMQIEVENALSDLEYAEHRMESLDTDVLSAIGEKAALSGLQIMVEMVVVRQRKALQSYYERYGAGVTITG